MTKAPENAWTKWLDGESPSIERALEESLPAGRKRPESIHRAMRYAVFSGGKRIRPGLSVLGYRAEGGKGDGGAQLGAAIEMLHTFSLIHDDLPCMDDDDLRRGRPTVHKEYDEATAVLAGDALQVLAFDRIGRLPASAERRLRVLTLITEAVGTEGVIGGQVVDIESEGQEISPQRLRWIHRHKTGALLRASLVGGAVLAGANASRIERLTEFGEAFGLLFQSVDDLLNEVGSFETLGRETGGDREKGKATYPSVLGTDGTRRALQTAFRRCRETVPVNGSRGEVFHGLIETVVIRLPEEWSRPLLAESLA
ncbi:MAG: polyprenyl synthetase family protein [Candidatus Eisenbacteria bacterium]